MDDLGLNKWLDESFGRTPEGYPYFRLIWSTGITEHRYSEFHDYYGDIFVRAVREVREVLKYPFAQDRWIIERIRPITKEARKLGLQSEGNFCYEEVYIFQDREGNFLPLDRQMVEVAIYLYFKHVVSLSRKQRTDIRMEMLAKKELEKKKQTRELIGDGGSPFTFVLE